MQHTSTASNAEPLNYEKLKKMIDELMDHKFESYGRLKQWLEEKYKIDFSKKIVILPMSFATKAYINIPPPKSDDPIAFSHHLRDDFMIVMDKPKPYVVGEFWEKYD